MDARNEKQEPKFQLEITFRFVWLFYLDFFKRTVNALGDVLLVMTEFLCGATWKPMIEFYQCNNFQWTLTFIDNFIHNGRKISTKST